MLIRKIMNNKTKLGIKIVYHFFLGILFLSAIILKRLAYWFNDNFTISFEEILFTIKSPLQGANIDFLNSAINYIKIQNLVCIIICYFFIVFSFNFVFSKLSAKIIIKIKEKKLIVVNLYVLISLILLIVIVSFVINSIRITNKALGISDYILLEKNSTKIYEEKAIQPSNEIIHGQGKNLIYIYIESLETTYAAKSDGGVQEINYIPNLTRLANENISFSPTDKLGGFHSTSGSSWTIAALFASSCGLPFKFPVGNEMNLRKKFASGVCTIGDVLKEKGYNQEFLCGSDGEFAGRKQFYTQHGDYKVFDLYTAREKGYIDADYYVWWGFEDEILYKIAKDEILFLAEKNEPFNFTMLTVDTHHVGGYKCRLCNNTYSENLANVLECTDRQIFDFIQWCKEQDFFENTVIVISGDHPRMDSILVDGVSYYDRNVYNCFINSSKTPKLPSNGRECTVLDMFPTVLSAMGFEIDGSRLGLGTDLFSEKKTFAEEMGFQQFNEELAKYSRYFIDNFS